MTSLPVITKKKTYAIMTTHTVAAHRSTLRSHCCYICTVRHIQDMLPGVHATLPLHGVGHAPERHAELLEGPSTTVYEQCTPVAFLPLSQCLYRAIAAGRASARYNSQLLLPRLVALSARAKQISVRQRFINLKLIGSLPFHRCYTTTGCSTLLDSTPTPASLEWDYINPLRTMVPHAQCLHHASVVGCGACADDGVRHVEGQSNGAQSSA